jgi:hypothetical protein
MRIALVSANAFIPRDRAGGRPADGSSGGAGAHPGLTRLAYPRQARTCSARAAASADTCSAVGPSTMTRQIGCVPE